MWAIPYARFGLFPVRSPLLGESILSFFSLGYLDVSVPLVRLYPLFYSKVDAGILLPAGSPIRVPPDLHLFAAPRGLSQLTTPFIAY